MNWQPLLDVPLPSPLTGSSTQSDLEEHFYALVKAQSQICHFINNALCGSTDLFPNASTAANFLTKYFYENIRIIKLISHDPPMSKYSAEMRSASVIADHVHFYAQAWIIHHVPEAHLSKSIPEPPYFNQIILYNPVTDVPLHTGPGFRWIKHAIACDWDIEPYLENLLTDFTDILRGEKSDEYSPFPLTRRTIDTVQEYLDRGNTIEERLT
jgi:hypothetical protein